MARKTRRPKAPKPVKILAAYTPDPKPRAICPRCWSRPSVSERVRKENNGERGWSLSFSHRKADGIPVGVTRLVYPCSNPECLTYIEVDDFITPRPEPAPWIRKGILRGADADRYRAGRTTSRGIWEIQEPSTAEDTFRESLVRGIRDVAGSGIVSDPYPPPDHTGFVETRQGGLRTAEEKLAEAKKPSVGCQTEESGPWLFITCPVFDAAYPSGWTRDGRGRLKVRKGTDRHELVKKFFRQRGVTL